MKPNLIYLNILHVLNDGYFSSLILILPFIVKALHLSLLQAGILGGLTGAIGIFLALPAGHASARIGGMKVLFYAAIIYALAYMLLSVSNNFFTVFLFFLLAALGFGIFHPIGFGLIAKFSDKKSRGAEIGKFTAVGDIGKIGISAGVTFLVTLVGWRQASFLYGFVAAVILGFFVLLNRKNPHTVPQEKPKDVRIKDLLKNNRFLLATTAGTLDVFASFPLFVFLPFLLLSKGFSPSILGTLVGAYLIGNLMGKTVLGHSIDRFGHVKVFVLAEVLMALFIVLLATSNNLVLIIIYSIFLGTLTKGTVPITQTMVTDAVEHHGNFEKSISVYSTIANTSVAAAPVLLGAISDRMGVNFAFFTAAAFAVSATFPALFIPFIKSHGNR